MFGGASRSADDGGMPGGFRRLDSSGWVACFDRLASSAAGGLVAVEVVARPTDGGAGPARRLREIRYDAADEVIEVLADERAAGAALVVRHLIFDPRAIAVRDGARSVALAVLDASGVWTRIEVDRSVPARPRSRSREGVACAAGERAERRRAGLGRPRADVCRPAARCRHLGRLRAPAAGGAPRCG